MPVKRLCAYAALRSSFCSRIETTRRPKRRPRSLNAARKLLIGSSHAAIGASTKTKIGRDSSLLTKLSQRVELL